MAHYFIGKAVAQEKEKQLIKNLEKLKRVQQKPKLASILVGNDLSSELYLQLKKEAAERVGCSLSVVNFTKSVGLSEIIKRIKELNNYETVNGIMLQLPLPKKYSKEDRDKIINTISTEKDVDGMNENSRYKAPVVQAVIDAFYEAIKVLRIKKPKSLNILVVGNKGFEGEKIFNELSTMGYKVKGIDIESRNTDPEIKSADVLISATGVTNLIKPNMTKEGVILIDVGSPKGDIDKSTYKNASFVSPVPGGIGPLTVIYLLINLVESTKKV